MAKLLVVVGHPGDEVLGCGGTICKLARQGWVVDILVVAEGLGATLEDSEHAAMKLGANSTKNLGYPNNRLEEVGVARMADEIGLAIEDLKPDLTITHTNHDLSNDHRLVHEAVLVASRLARTDIWAFQTLGSSDRYSSNGRFAPSTFVTLDEALVREKQTAMDCYGSEVKEYPHPRSRKGIEVQAMATGMSANLHYAEAFEVVRAIA